MENAKVWEWVRSNVRALTMSRKRVRMVIKGAFENILYFFERSTKESNKIRHVPAKSIVNTVAMWSSKSREKVK